MNALRIKHFYLLLALFGMLFFTVACEDDPEEKVPSHKTLDPEPITIPTDDQMDVKVSAAMPTAVFSTFADNTTGAAQIESRLRSKFPDCYKDMLSLCDRTATSVQMIAANVEYAKRVFKNNEDILQQFAQEQNVEKFTIHWRCDNPEIQLREGYAVENP